MSTKHPLLKRGGPSPGALGPPALKQACLEEGEGEGEGEVLTVRIKEEEQEESQTSGAFSAWGSNERPLQEEDPPFVCHVCSLPFPSPRALLAHQPSHLDPRPFKCPICGDGFEQPAALASHERRHLRQSRYVCRDCAMPHVSARPAKPDEQLKRWFSSLWNYNSDKLNYNSQRAALHPSQPRPAPFVASQSTYPGHTWCETQTSCVGGDRGGVKQE
ncbi:Zinc finger protein 169 [Acipenser ruthenus]|uniref:Zinc finger protein 169 n=1 Tax=Acipenser ruthenus TaxID=7906 RepID=A0A444U9P0_ACIRT|nr:Zinc finger protein 169 [Acipenser ruthenus]